MSVFCDEAALYRVLDALFSKLAQQEEVAKPLLAGNFVLRFRYTEPEAQVTVDLRGSEVRWECGPSDLEPDLEMMQSGDIAHQFWLGKLNVARALATRQVVARGPVGKALKLLPAVKPAFPIYAEVLRELGLDELLGEADGTEASESLGDRVSHELGRLGGWLRSQVDQARRRGDPTPLDASGLGRTPGPVLEPLGDGSVDRPPEFRDPGLPTEEAPLKREMLQRMELIRAFEQRLSDGYRDGAIPTEAIHLSIGQEATAVGVCFALRADDYVATTHRGHGHMIAKGADVADMMAEILGKATGLCGGKGGSMHVTDAAVGAIGANGIVGASPLMAAGAAHSAVQRGTDQVAVAFLGDGATNQGMFHEAVNFAAVFDLPVLIVIENNQYGEFTPLERHCRVRRLSDRAAAYGIAGETVDGNDVWAVYEAASRAVARAREGGGPMLLECLTYRWHGHMEGETAAYRGADELASWKRRCPIATWREALADAGVCSESDADALRDRASERIAEAWERGAAAPQPEPRQLITDVYAPEPAEVLEAGPVQPAVDEREITCSEALFEALTEELERDERVYLMGEDVTTGGYFSVTAGLVDRFGTDRIVDTPISEYAIVGSAVGAAMTGRRPICEILFSDFLTTCMDPLVNQAAKLRYMSGGQYALPLVVRTPGGAGLGMAAQHSQSLEALLAGIPGLLLLAPATPYDAKGLLKAAVRSNNPVVFFENKLGYTATGVVPTEPYLVPIGRADVKRRGADVTIVSIGAVLGRVLEAAGELEGRGVDAEVIDLRTIVPWDREAVIQSVARTGRLVTVEDAPVTHGFGAEILASVVERAHHALRAAPLRVAGVDVPLAYDSGLENLAIPTPDQIVEAVRSRC
ncbi:MAG: hypothetical protein JRI23_36185 [Deltaproteobacteria bacterium]|jgi:pyruvate/2-oxoglutarate/acetoin dehydrogenase E1 component/TPP-dependent pyruvate/acetoin dehydrogenase alpha subunit|nr:hypothetical protein [Deltaproteobacteria bacterium]MBW2537789.1 hypothetical protein [Deltaproteobacteria bacterium]